MDVSNFARCKLSVARKLSLSDDRTKVLSHANSKTSVDVWRFLWEGEKECSQLFNWHRFRAVSLGAGKFCKCGICKASWRAEEWFSISVRSRLPQLASLQACVVESFVSSVTLAFASFLPPSNTNVHSLERRTGELTNALHHLTSSLQSLVFCVYPHWFAHCVLFDAAHIRSSSIHCLFFQRIF